jgi:hypothetical protein
MAAFGRRLVYAAVGSVLLLAVLFLLQTGPAPLKKAQAAGHGLLRRQLHEQDDAGVQDRARKEVSIVAGETRHVEKQISGIMPGGGRAPPRA